MRILKITLTNLNSLKGTWEIDLEHPEYVNNGIFAICGPTGAGKSTLLDAVSLALYQGTPRQEHVSKSCNEVMTRGTGECVSEVTFEADGQRWRARWSQRRARGEADGRLQDAVHELSRLNPETGQWDLEPLKPRDVPGRIEAVTGLGLQQFNRSMLLAQGNFAAFMKAPAAERAQALENITGTEIYSRISQRVQQTYARLGTELDGLRHTLDGMEVLSDEEAALRRGQAETLEMAISQAQTAIGELDAAIAWRGRVSGLEADCAKIGAELETKNRERAELALEKPRLEAAERAAALREDFALLSASRGSAGELAREAQQHAAGAARVQTALEQALKAHEAAAADEKKSAAALEELQRLLKRVRELDTRLAEARGNVGELERRHQEASAAVLKNETQLRQLEHQIASERTRRDRLAESLAPESPRVRLYNSRDALAGALSIAFARAGDINGLEREAADAADGLKAASGRVKAIAPRAAAAREQYVRSKAALEALANQGSQLLEGRTLEAITLEKSRRSERRSRLDEALKCARTLADVRAAMARCSDGAARALDEAARAAEANRQALEHSDALEELLDQIHEKASLMTLIEQLAEERGRLKDGEPCPLCGSTSHPWAHEKPRPSDAIEKERSTIAELQRAHKRVQQTLAAAAAADTRAETFRNELKTRRAEFDRRAEELADAIVELFPDGLPEPDGGDEQSEPLLEEQFIRVAGQQISIESVRIARLDELARQAAGIAEGEARGRKACESARLAQQAAEKDLAQAQTDEAVRRTALEALQKRLAASQKECDGALGRLSELLAQAGLEPVDLKALPETRRLVEESIRQCGEDLKGLQTLNAGLEADEKSADQARRQAGDLARALAAAKGELDDALKKTAALVAERRTLFGDRDPDREESRAKVDFSARQNAARTALENLNKARSSLELFKRTAGDLEQRLTRERAALAERETLFSQALCAAGFQSEALWSAARMDPRELKARLDVHKQTASECERLEKNLDERRNLLEAEKKSPRTDESLEALNEKKSAQTLRFRELSQQVGEIRERLRVDAELRSRRHQTIERIARAEARLRVWEKLYALIGSHDGRKYREFVQSITFETLIAFANEALVRMTDRYVLTSSAMGVLELDVIDNYQGGVVRSSSNLSGGETFIASLALALGLSRMSSRSVQVDSLFLDEGFGTLDPEALDNTLGMLATLNEQGKLIGIISHVGEIRERIAARIDVIPCTGGVSRLEGPGVREIRKNNDGKAAEKPLRTSLP